MTGASDELDLPSRLARLEARVARLEASAGLETRDEESPLAVSRASEESIERQLAQTWFARIGVCALAAGGAYLLMQPYPGLPAGVPSVVGWVVAGLLFLVARLGRSAFGLLSRHARAVGMALFFCATVRLCRFGATPVIAPTSWLSDLALAGAAALNLLIAWRRGSAHLLALALIMAAAVPVALNDSRTVLVSCPILTLLVGFVGRRRERNVLLGFGMLLVVAVYANWAMGSPLSGDAYRWMPAPVVAPLVLLTSVVFMALLPLWRDAPCDTAAGGATAFVNTVFGYGIFLVHTYAVGHPWFTTLQSLATVALLGVAALLWWRRQSQVATFFYAMCAYAALTVAIVHVAVVPNVFVWLSIESVVVVATAIWFRSQFIVITNFVIYVVVVLGYLLANPAETGVSLGFGLVALVSARILNWQRHRLALKTELMRNAYLVSAFAIFPYALFHLVGARYAALAWVGLAVIYYGLNLVIQNQKYRWMAHATLVLTTGYLLVPGHEGLTLPVRLASFVALGAAFLGVSVTSTLTRPR